MNVSKRDKTARINRSSSCWWWNRT